MRIITRYLLSEILGFFFVIILAFSVVLVSIRMLRFTDLIFNKGVEAFQIAKVFISVLPPFLEIALPLSALLAVLLAVSRLSSDSELIVLRGSGIKFITLTIPVAIFASIVFIFHSFTSLYLKPSGVTLLQQTLFEIARSRTTAGIDPGVFSELGALTLYASEIDYNTGVLSKVLLEDKRGETSKIINAQTGRIVSDSKTRTLSFLLEDGSIHEIIEGAYLLTDFEQNQIITDTEELYSGQEATRGQQSTEMPLREIRANLNELSTRIINQDITSDSRSPSELELRTNWRLISLDELNKRFNRLSVELTKRFMSPLPAIFFPFLGLVLGVFSPRHNRSWGLSLSIGLGLLCFALYFGFVTIGTAFAESGKMLPWVVFLVPSILGILAAVYCIKLLNSERVNSIVDLILERK